jgi:hypothetical protein
LIQLCQDPVWLQAQNFDLPTVHLQDHSNQPDLTALYGEVCNTWNHCTVCRKEREEAGAWLSEQHHRCKSASEWEQQAEHYQLQATKLSKLHDEWDKSVEMSAAADICGRCWCSKSMKTRSCMRMHNLAKLQS